MSRVLLREFQSFCSDGSCLELLTEAEKNLRSSGTTILSGVCAVAEEKNGNGRIYPQAVLEREVAEYQKVIKEGRALAQLDHPDDEQISYQNASHMFLRLWLEGNKVFGTCKVLSTPQGQILEALIRDGVGLGISSRGVGSVRNTHDAIIVEDDFKLLGFDFVQEASAPGAYMRPINEAMERRLFSRADRVTRMLNGILK